MTPPARSDQHAARGSTRQRPLRRAWVGVALIPVALVLAFVASEVLVLALGYEPMSTVPLWVDILAWLVTVLLVLLPSTAAAYYGRQAWVLGDRRGRFPLTLAAIAPALVTLIAVSTIASTPHA